MATRRHLRGWDFSSPPVVAIHCSGRREGTRQLPCILAHVGAAPQSGEAAIYAVEDGAEAIGAIAVGRDLTSALSIIEQGGPCNAPLPVIVRRAVQKWIGQANADASRSA